MLHPRDVALGHRIKQVREAQDPHLTQLWLAREIGVTMQQVQKYENGTNRVTFSRLCEIADALNVHLVALIEPLFPPRG